MDGINKNNIKTLKSLKKLLENEYMTVWPDAVKMHKQAIINAVTNAIDTGEVVLSFGGTKTIANDAQASQKLDLFAGSNEDMNGNSYPNGTT